MPQRIATNFPFGCGGPGGFLLQIEFRRFLTCIVRSLEDSPGRLAHLSVPFLFFGFFAAILRAQGDPYRARQKRERGSITFCEKQAVRSVSWFHVFHLTVHAILTLIVPVLTVEMSVSYVICLLYYISDLTLIRAIRMIPFF